MGLVKPVNTWVNLNIELPYDPALPLPDMYLKELKTDIQTDNMYTHVHGSVIHSSQKVETQKSINR